MAIQIRPITDPHDPAIPAFGRLQERTFPCPLTSGATPAHHFAALLRHQHQVPPLRRLCGQHARQVLRRDQHLGVARALHEARFALLDQAAEAAAPVAGLFIDVVAPERLTPEELEGERAVGADPVARLGDASDHPGTFRPLIAPG